MPNVQLEQLYGFQDPGILRSLIPPTLFSLASGESIETSSRTFTMEVILPIGAEPETEVLEVSWNLPRLRPQYPNLEDDLRLLREKASPLGERTTELAAYGLAFCALQVWLPGKRVVRFNNYRAPDLILTVEKNIGVEVAGRVSGGAAAVRSVLEPNAKGKSNMEKLGKVEGLRRISGFAEIYLNVWVLESSLGHFQRIR